MLPSAANIDKAAITPVTPLTEWDFLAHNAVYSCSKGVLYPPVRLHVVAAT
jgi:hypothetical protein